MGMRNATLVRAGRLLMFWALLAAATACTTDRPLPDRPDPPVFGPSRNPTPTPPGPYTVSGTVAQASGAVLGGATVTVSWAAGTTSTRTRQNGSFDLLAEGETTIRAEMAGFNSVERQLTVTGSIDNLYFGLPHTMPANAFRLALAASPSCSLPVDASSREYQAALTDSPEGVRVVLGGASFIAFTGEPGFTGRRDGGTVSFSISDDDFGDHAFIERLPATGIYGLRWLMISGTATGVADDNRIVVTLSGRIRVVGYPGEHTLADCQAADHRLEFAR